MLGKGAYQVYLFNIIIIFFLLNIDLESLAKVKGSKEF